MRPCNGWNMGCSVGSSAYQPTSMCVGGCLPANPLISRLASTAQLNRLTASSSWFLTNEGGKVIIATAFRPLTRDLKACKNR